MATVCTPATAALLRDACPTAFHRAPAAILPQSSRRTFASPMSSAFKGTHLKALSSSSATQQRMRPLRSIQAYLVQKVTADELDNLLDAERTSPVVVDFYATWCGPCVILAQELEQLALEYGDKVKFVKVDTDEEYELASDMEIRGLPTLVFISKDAKKTAIRTEGLLPPDVIRDIIEKEL